MSGGLVVAQAALLARALDAVFVRGAAAADIAWLLAALGVAAFLRAGALWQQEVSARRFSVAVRLGLRKRSVRQLIRAGPSPLAGERAGEVTETLLGGIEALDGWLAQYVPQRSLAVLVPLLVLGAVASVDLLSALVLALTGPLIPLFAWLVATSARGRALRQWGRLQVLSARFLEAVQGMETLRAARRLETEERRIEAAGEAHRETTMDLLRLAFVSTLVLELIGTLGTAVVAVELGLRLLGGGISFDAALFVLLLTPELYRPMRALGAAFHVALPGQEAARRLLALTERSPATEPTGASDPPGWSEEPVVGLSSGARGDTPPTLVLEDVRYAYAPDRPPAIDGLSLVIGSGETVALVGPSGAGKTTVASLLLRFVLADSGLVSVDGRPLALEDPVAWRRRIAWVPQRPSLLEGTLGENLLWAAPEASPSEIDEALDAVGLLPLVRTLPRGLATPFGESAGGLSGGELQRIAVARALLRKDALLVVLDEPTAHLDPRTERVLVDAIDGLRKGRTALLIAHRLTAALQADRVAVVVSGRVAECGAPAELTARGGVFGGLVAAWKGAA